MKPRTIKDLDDILIIKDHFKWMSKHKGSQLMWDKQLLFFEIGINTCYKADELLNLKWEEILSKDKQDIRDYVSYRNYQFFLNNSCKNAVYEFIDKYKDCSKNTYIFSRNTDGEKRIALQTVEHYQEWIDDDLQLPFKFSPISLRKTFVYWQIYYNKRDYIKMTKLNELIHEGYDYTSIHKYSEFEVVNDKIYVNDVNL